MKLWSAFYPDVIIELPGAPLILVDHWLRNAAIDFCKRSKAYRVTLDPVGATGGQIDLIDIPNETEVVEIIAATWKGDSLEPRSASFLSKKYGLWQDEVGDPEFFLEEQAQFVMVPTPVTVADGDVVLSVALCPDDAATGIIDWMFSKYRIDIAIGVKAKMMAMANVAWGNPESAMNYAAEFEARIQDARSKATDGKAIPRYSGSWC